MEPNTYQKYIRFLCVCVKLDGSAVDEERRHDVSSQSCQLWSTLKGVVFTKSLSFEYLNPLLRDLHGRDSKSSVILHQTLNLLEPRNTKKIF